MRRIKDERERERGKSEQVKEITKINIHISHTVRVRVRVGVEERGKLLKHVELTLIFAWLNNIWTVILVWAKFAIQSFWMRWELSKLVEIP